MKSQKHNVGECVTLTVKIEKELAETLERMAEKANVPKDELVTIALKRFRSSHAELEGCVPIVD